MEAWALPQRSCETMAGKKPGRGGPSGTRFSDSPLIFVPLPFRPDAPCTAGRELGKKPFWKARNHSFSYTFVVGQPLVEWNEIAKIPGISAIVSVVTREALPRADPQRFSIAVVHLEGDTNSELEQALIDALRRFVDQDEVTGERACKFCTLIVSSNSKAEI
jgi:hypothetical protein